MTGINVDPRNPHGSPNAGELNGFTSARFVYNVSNYVGSTDVNAAEQVYRPYILSLLESAITPIVVITHQTGLEGQGFDFENMTSARWAEFRMRIVGYIRDIASRYVGRRIIWQIMNEQDSLDNTKSVVIPPIEFGHIFNESYVALKSIDKNFTVITGGYNSGPDLGAKQFNSSKIAKDASGNYLADGLAFHPYGAGAGGYFNQDGIATLPTQISRWKTLVPKMASKLYITEIGLTNAEHHPEWEVAAYAKAIVSASTTIRETSWFAWSHAMDSSYGYIAQNGTRREVLKRELTKGSSGLTTIDSPLKISGLTSSLYVRSAPVVKSGNIVGLVFNGAKLRWVSDKTQYDGKYYWREIVLENGTRGYSATNAAGEFKITL